VQAADDVERLYRKQCGVCHGDEGDGRGRAGANLQPPASSFTALRDKLNKKNIAQAIRDGKKGTAMVAYGRRLSESQIAALADYIMAHFVGHKTGDKTPAGKQLYIEHCAACHGDNGNTAVWAKNGLTPPPRNFTSEAAREELSRERMITSVTYGRPGTAMMSFQRRLDAQQIESVVDFIRASFMSEESSKSERSSASDASANFPKGLVGDSAAGEKFYMNNCFTCHGKQGDGKGPRAHFNYPRPRDFTSADTQQRFDRPALFHAIKKGKKGTVMPAWETVLNDQQVANIAEFVYLTFIKKKL